jgi:hypothetical protein
VTTTWKVLLTQQWNDSATNPISILINAPPSMDPHPAPASRFRPPCRLLVTEPSCGFKRNLRFAEHSAARRSDSILKTTNRLQRRGAWRAKSPNISHRRLAEETAVFAIELAGAFVSNVLLSSIDDNSRACVAPLG